MSELNGKLFNWKEFNLEEVDCPLCGSDCYTIYERYGDEEQYTYVKCKNCNFLYQNPRFEYNQKFLDWAYTSYGNQIIDEANSIGSFDAFIEKRSGYFRYKKDLMDRFVAKDFYEMADIGASCGEFVYFCQKDGNVDVTAVETSKVQADFIKDKLKLKVINSTSMDPELQSKRFDLVHCAHTLEHVDDPVSVLKSLVNITKDGGTLLLEVPNVYSLQNYSKHVLSKYNLKKNSWRKGDFPEHLVEFSLASFKKLISSCKLKLVYSVVHSRKIFEKNVFIKSLDILLNRIVPYSNNIICVAKKV